LNATVNVVSAAAGLLLVAISLRDVFQGVIVPRAENTVLRISRYVMRGTWAIWPGMARFFYPRNERKRENFLAIFAPFHLLMMLAIWVALLVIGWALFFYGVREQLSPPNIDFSGAVYYAGASLLTIGYGDIVAHSAFARVMSLVAAACGLGVVAVVTSFLFAVFGSFQQRERFVVTLSARAGVPPSGVGLLAVHGYSGLRGDLAQVFREGQGWTATVMESHLAYPVLAMFRSSHDDHSWVGTLTALLDASALVMSVLDTQQPGDEAMLGQARLMYDIGRHLAYDFAEYFEFDGREPGSGVERIEFDAACRRLQSAGYAVADPQAAWTKFQHLRSAYAAPLNAMARWLDVPRVQWLEKTPA
jgi:hypothetical protein